MDLIEFAQAVTSPDKKLIIDAPNLSKTVRLITDLGFSHSDVGRKVYLAANLSCRNCKEHGSIVQDFDQSVHSFRNIDPMNTDPNQKKVPLCGDCHDSHYVSASIKKNAAFLAATRANSKSLCGGCHEEEYESYDDTYHGKPYKNGSERAPACWDCHSTHNVRADKDPISSVSSFNIVNTCGGCHEGCDETFVAYSPMLHGRQRILGENPIVQLKDGIINWIYENITVTVKQVFIDPTQKFLSGKYNEYLHARDESVTVPTRTD
jgi:cytochrome c553